MEVFSESSTNIETKVAKQNALERIVKLSYTFLETHSAIETVVYAVTLLKMMNCLMQVSVPKFKVMEN
jgi:hypothetical protein